MMTSNDFVYTQKYMHQYGNACVVAIKNRIRQDKLIDTGALLDSIAYHLKITGMSFDVIFTIGDGVFSKGSGLPSEYGMYQDQGTRYIRPHYFFTAPIPNLTVAIYKQKMKEAMLKDTNIYLKKQLKKLTDQNN